MPPYGRLVKWRAAPGGDGIRLALVANLGELGLAINETDGDFTWQIHGGAKGGGAVGSELLASGAEENLQVAKMQVMAEGDRLATALGVRWDVASETRTLNVTLSEDSWLHLEGILEGLRTGGTLGSALRPGMSISDLVEDILAHWADGYRRAGSWERQLLDMMGHV